MICILMVLNGNYVFFSRAHTQTLPLPFSYYAANLNNPHTFYVFFYTGVCICSSLSGLLSGYFFFCCVCTCILPLLTSRRPGPMGPFPRATSPSSFLRDRDRERQSQTPAQEGPVVCRPFKSETIRPAYNMEMGCGSVRAALLSV